MFAKENSQVSERQSPPDLSGIFEKRLSDICGSIADVETRCSMSEARANAAEARAEEAELEAYDYADRCFSTAWLSPSPPLPACRKRDGVGTSSPVLSLSTAQHQLEGQH